MKIKTTELAEKFIPDLSNEFFAKRNGLNLEEELTEFSDLHRSQGNKRNNWQSVFRKHLKTAAADHGRIPVPSWLPTEDWNDYLAMRRRRRRGASPGTQKLAVQKLDELRHRGYAVSEVLRQSINHEWAGLFPTRR